MLKDISFENKTWKTQYFEFLSRRGTAKETQECTYFMNQSDFKQEVSNPSSNESCM